MRGERGGDWEALFAPYSRAAVGQMLAQAKSVKDGVISLINDEGGIVAVVVPASYIRCSAAALIELHLCLNMITWPTDSARMTRIEYRRLNVGDHVPGSIGGEGEVIDGIWAHRTYEELGIAEEIRDVIQGRAERLETSSKWAYPIIRYHDDEGLAIEARFRYHVVKIVWSETEANLEVERLNAMVEEGESYFAGWGLVMHPEQGMQVETAEMREQQAFDPISE